MKKTVIVSVLSSLMISLGAITGYHYLYTDDDHIEIKPIVDKSTQKVSYAANTDGEIIPLDFTKTTEKVLDAVVHISSKKMMPAHKHGMYQYRELPNPFRDFFGGQNPLNQFFQKSPPHQKKNMEKEQPNIMPILGTGSGVIINDKGYILTNNHVIENADEIEITLHNNETYKAMVVGTDPSTDLALLQIKANNLTALPLVNSDDVRVGEWVLAVGNPFSLNSTVTAGIVSAKARNININKDKFAVESFIQTDAAINPGNSGGALVNLNGDLIGINTAIASRTGTYNGYGFAVPSNIAGKVVEDLLKYGVVQRGILGISIRTMDGKLAREKNRELKQGVYVDKVADNSAAEKAGLKEGDVILSIEGKKLTTSPALQEIIAQKRPGDKVKIAFDRNGKEKEIIVTLAHKNGAAQIEEASHRDLLNRLGAEFEAIDKATAKQLGLDSGVKITTLYVGKLQRETQIRSGFIITHIDGEKMSKVEDIVEVLKHKEGGVMIEGIYEDLPGKYYYAIGLDA